MDFNQSESNPTQTQQTSIPNTPINIIVNENKSNQSEKSNQTMQSLYEKLNSLYDFYEKSLLTSIITSQISSILYIFYVYFSVPFYYIGILTGISLVFLLISMNIYLKMKVFLDKINENEGVSFNFGVIIVYICGNFSCLSGMFLIILVTLKFSIDSMRNMSFSVLSIPIYLLLMLGIVYFVFILPALITYRKWSEIGLYCLMIILMFIFIVMINVKVSQVERRSTDSISLGISLGIDSAYDSDYDSAYDIKYEMNSHSLSNLSWMTISIPFNLLIIYILYYKVLEFHQSSSSSKNSFSLVRFIMLSVQFLGFLMMIFGVNMMFLYLEYDYYIVDNRFFIVILVGSYIILSLYKILDALEVFSVDNESSVESIRLDSDTSNDNDMKGKGNHKE